MSKSLSDDIAEQAGFTDNRVMLRCAQTTSDTDFQFTFLNSCFIPTFLEGILNSKKIHTRDIATSKQNNQTGRYTVGRFIAC